VGVSNAGRVEARHANTPRQEGRATLRTRRVGRSRRPSPRSREGRMLCEWYAIHGRAVHLPRFCVSELHRIQKGENCRDEQPVSGYSEKVGLEQGRWPYMARMAAPDFHLRRPLGFLRRHR
jgi:hypothetical protein